MGKYYVQSGTLRVVISRNDIEKPIDAACEACLSYYDSNTKAEKDIRVSERGFEHHDTDSLFDTLFVLRKAGFEFE